MEFQLWKDSNNIGLSHLFIHRNNCNYYMSEQTKRRVAFN